MAIRRDKRARLRKPPEGGPTLARWNVKLEPGDAPENANEPKWQHIAFAGEYRGYLGGARPFQLTRETFERVVENFRKHPSYQAGPDGVGRNGVIAWDFHHASEADETSGVIPVAGAPAQGWVLELDVQDGEDGRAQLWALTKWLEPARTYVAQEQYKWASVALVFDAVDGVSGERLGPMLTSVALTNQPFIEGMEPLVAQRGRSSEDRRQLMRWMGAADSPEEALERFKQTFGLPATATVTDVMGEVGKLRSQVASGTVPFGVDANGLVAEMREVLNLRTLATADEVFAEAEQLVGRLIEDRAVGADQQPSGGLAPQPQATSPEAGAMTTRNASMDPIKLFAGKLGVKESQEAVAASLDAKIEIADAVARMLELDAHASDRTLLQRLEVIGKVKAERDKLSEGLHALLDLKLEATGKTPEERKAERARLSADAAAKIGSILRTAGVEDADQRVQRVIDSFAQAMELGEVMPELKELKKREGERMEDEQTEDVAAAMQRQGFTLDREGQPETEAGRVTLKALKAQHAELGRKKFREAFELDEEDANPELLTNHFAAGGGRPVAGGSSQAPRPVRASRRSGLPAQTAEEARVALSQGGVVDISAYPGPNDSARAVAAYRAIVPGADKLDHAVVCEKAFQLKHKGVFQNLAAAAAE